MIKDLNNLISSNRFIKWIYSQEQDFQNGRGFFGKFTSLTGEFSLAILVCTHIFNIDLSKNIKLAITWTILVMLFVYVFGKIYRLSGMLETDQRASANRSPVEGIKLDAAEIIIKRFGDKKDDINIYGDKH